jgi:hypothetical protein
MIWHRLQILITKEQYKYLVKQANAKSEVAEKDVSIGEVVRVLIDQDQKKNDAR